MLYFFESNIQKQRRRKFPLILPEKDHFSIDKRTSYITLTGVAN